MIHKDIKLENVLLGYNGKAKLCDFDESVHFTKRQSLIVTDLHGTVYAMAPELFIPDHEYRKDVDIWSLDVVTFLLGSRPERKANLWDNLECILFAFDRS